MRTLYFLLPGLGGKYACGGLWAELKTVKLIQSICSAEVVTYKQREPNTLFLADILGRSPLEDHIFVINWGFDIPMLLKKLVNQNVIYHAHSAGYGFHPPSSVPIITVSRNTLGYWGQNAPQSLIYYLPNHISESFTNLNQERDIDVLVQVRKSSEYLLDQLIPALQTQCRVKVINHFVDDLNSLFNRTKVYLYDSAEYWALQNVSEGFGLQPMEALACGCYVFSSLNGGLSDYLDPGFNCEKISGYALEFDCWRILNVVRGKTPWKSIASDTLAEYRQENIQQRATQILQEINLFFDQKCHLQTPICTLSWHRILQLRWRHLIQKLSMAVFMDMRSP